MTLVSGSRLGPYEIVGTLGAGGMGEVYRARDARLKRDVALKVLPEALAADPDRLARFQREAEVLASLNHPHIAAIYGIEVSAGVRAIVMELVEGETLAERIARGAIPVDEALSIARQVAEALEAAHEQGVVHRDLKPANIKVRDDGTVKVLDFGLAKLAGLSEANGAHAAGAGRDMSMSPTITSPALITGVGSLLGTAAYMAPEQAKGGTGDRRSDVWAFGCVLYEMLTGRRAFDGIDVGDTLASVLKIDPDWTVLPTNVPRPIRVLLAACLAKDRRARPGDMSAALFAIDHYGDVSALSQAGERTTPRRRALVAAAASVVLLGSIVVYAAMTLRPRAPSAVTRLTVVLPEGDRFSSTGRHVLAISPSGRDIVYSANSRLYLRSLDRLDASAIAGTEGPTATSGRSPFFSPDGQWVGFWKDGELKKMAISGGAPATLCKALIPWGASWAADNTILYGQGPNGIWRVPAAGGAPENVVKVGREESAHGPQLLPDGRTVLFTLAKSVNWDDAEIVVQRLDTGERHVLVKGGTDARYLATGHLIYVHQGTLLAVPLDLQNLTTKGGPVPVGEDVGEATNPIATGAAHMSVSDNGTLVYVPASSLVGANTFRTLTWVDRNGREEPLPVPVRAYTYPSLSPDGSRLALDIRDQQYDIWVWDFVRRTMTRLTFDPGMDRAPVWTPDGHRIAFSSESGGATAASPTVFWQSADGAGSPERLSDTLRFPTDFTPDGAAVIGDGFSLQETRMAILPLDTRQPRELLKTKFLERNGVISPDGHWLAYESDVAGSQMEVFVRPYPDTSNGQWQISMSGGTRPRWSHNGRELFFVGSDGGIMSVRVEPGATWNAGTPRQVVRPGYVTAPAGQSYRTYDVSADGNRFLVIKNADAAAQSVSAAEIIVVENWFAELIRRVPLQ